MARAGFGSLSDTPVRSGQVPSPPWSPHATCQAVCAGVACGSPGFPGAGGAGWGQPAPLTVSPSIKQVQRASVPMAPVAQGSS